MISTVNNTLAGWPRSSVPHLCRVERLRGNEGAQSLAFALKELKQLKELEVGLDQNHIGAGPRGARRAGSSAPGIGDLSTYSSLR